MAWLTSRWAVVDDVVGMTNIDLEVVTLELDLNLRILSDSLHDLLVNFLSEAAGYLARLGVWSENNFNRVL